MLNYLAYYLAIGSIISVSINDKIDTESTFGDYLLTTIFWPLVVWSIPRK